MTCQGADCCPICPLLWKARARALAFHAIRSAHITHRKVSRSEKFLHVTYFATMLGSEALHYKLLGLGLLAVTLVSMIVEHEEK